MLDKIIIFEKMHKPKLETEKLENYYLVLVVRVLGGPCSVAISSTFKAELQRREISLSKNI